MLRIFAILLVFADTVPVTNTQFVQRDTLIRQPPRSRPSLSMLGWTKQGGLIDKLEKKNSNETTVLSHLMREERSELKSATDCDTWAEIIPNACDMKVDYSKMLNYIYYGTILATAYAQDETDCAAYCYSNVLCESANHYTETNICELNSDQRMKNLPDFKYRQRVTYIDSVKCKSDTEKSTAACGRWHIDSRITTNSLAYAQHLHAPMNQMSETRPGSMPWMVSIRKDKKHICSAVLIHANYALTSASCFGNNIVSIDDYDVIIGGHSQTSMTVGQQTAKVHSITAHSKYDWRLGRVNDIALVRFAQTANIGRPNTNILPICPPPENVGSMLNEYTTCNTAGWGKLAAMPSVEHLSQLITPLIHQATCNRPDVYAGRVTPKMLCAGYTNTSNCQADVGGPLLCQLDAGVWHILGVASWGDGCSMKGRPMVFTSVFHYLDWIRASTAVSR